MSETINGDTAATHIRDSSPAPADSPRVPPQVGIIWTCLVINTLGSTGAQTVVPIPRSVIQIVTMGSLLLAFALALLINLRLQIRPSAYLLLLSMLLVVSVVSSAHLTSGLGSLFRCFRFTVFVATLWLLTRWWGNNLTFVRHHIRAYGGVLVSVAIGLVIAPNLALSDIYGGRLVGAVWPLTPPQVAQYAAVIAGLTLLLWLGRQTDKWSVVFVAVPAIGLLLLTHTRTATLGLLVGLAVALLSMVLTTERARRVFGWAAVIAGIVAVAAGPALQAWFRRGQSDENLSNLTGRAKVWDALLDAPRTTSEQLFGVGLTNKSFDGLPIDNSWLAIYHEQGLIGIAIVATFLLTLLVVAMLRPPSLGRACAIYLIVYCLMASYTEAGLGDASPYLLHLAVAAGLLASTAPAPVAPLTRRLKEST